MISLPKSEFVKVWPAPGVGRMELLRATYVTQSFPRHTHEQYAIGVIERGALRFYYRGENMVAPSGAINLCQPGEVHTGQAAADEGWTYRMFYFDAGLLQRVASEVADAQRAAPVFRSGVIQDDALARQLRQLHLSLERSDTPRLDSESQLIGLLAQLMMRHAGDPPAVHRAGKEPKAVARIKHYLESHYANNVSIDDLSRLTNLSRFYLMRVFRETVGLPPQAYLRQVRLHRARALLASGESVAQAALAAGFADQSHLTRWFKRVWGFTPGQYRNSIGALARRQSGTDETSPARQ